MSTKVIGDYSAANSIDGSTNYLLIQPGNSSTAYNKINRNTFLGVSGQPADLTTVQTVQNKVLDNTNTITTKDTLFKLQDNADTTKQAQFELSGLTTATTRTYTLPDASTTVVGTGTTQTLTNKTLTSPTITGGTYDNGTITVDAIGGHTSANVVTVAGLQINNGALNTNNSVVTANITDSAVTPAKLQSGTGTGWTWQSWSPTLTNITLGSGSTVTANYIQTGKLVTANIYIKLGTGGAMGTTPTFTLPVTAASRYSTPTHSFIGDSFLTDEGVAIYQGSVELEASTTVGTFYLLKSDGTYLTIGALTATTPFTWGSSDYIFANIFYEAA